MSIGLLIIAAGLGIYLTAWGKYRKAGVGWWDRAPVWRIEDYLHPPGPLLYRIGMGIAAAGLVVHGTRAGWLLIVVGTVVGGMVVWSFVAPSDS